MKRREQRNKTKQKKIEQKKRQLENRNPKGFKYIGDSKLIPYIDGGIDVWIYRCLDCNSIVWTSAKGEPTCLCKCKQERVLNRLSIIFTVLAILAFSIAIGVVAYYNLVCK